MALNKAQILASVAKQTRVEVVIPEWEGSVFVHVPSAGLHVHMLSLIYANVEAHQAWKDDQAKPEDEREGVERVDLLDIENFIVMFSIADEDGKRVFEFEDFDTFLNIDHNIVNRIKLAYRDLVNETDHETEKKNSEITPKS